MTVMIPPAALRMRNLLPLIQKKGVVKYRFQIVLIAQHFLSVYCFGQG